MSKISIALLSAVTFCTMSGIAFAGDTQQSTAVEQQESTPVAQQANEPVVLSEVQMDQITAGVGAGGPPAGAGIAGWFGGFPPPGTGHGLNSTGKFAPALNVHVPEGMRVTVPGEIPL